MNREPIELRPRIGLVGDIHGNEEALSSALIALDEAGVEVAVQLGDFGLPFQNNEAEQRAIERIEALFDTFRLLDRVLVVHGNHDRIPSILPEPPEPIRWASSRHRIGNLARGHRATGGGRSILFAPGAGSVDLDFRVEGTSWWPDEALSDHEVDEIIADGPADVILAHDAPATSALEAALAETHRYWPPAGLDWASRTRTRFDRLHRSVRPLLTVSGHYHLALDTGIIEFPGAHGTEPFHSRSVILPEEVKVGAWQILDLATLVLELVVAPPRRRAQRHRELKLLLTNLAPGLTDAELAERVGLPRSTFSAIRSGHIEVSDHLIDRLWEEFSPESSGR